ncbi:MATE family efflux transporter [Muribaculaceae bacterium Isolate-042 (Harlan)]|uniref:Multidrug-efflux transporter n=2 Tax=Muribaculum intestinale TaxID=1796646 RepID=A0A4S2FST0_9BACT|nr:MATE family efflux transporter [Muribaculum intestinale]MYM13027.1 MATE family efflux transporter [Muribaculum intestinale]ROS81133.1 MATE family efflux transporter [Muribaculaceae bacterium Isolate-042 (Harlan)]TGY72242.1 MATE family efflux transporter [Muribaculum intestinale]
MDFRTQLRLTALLSLPAIVAQLSSIAMQYIDASMVGSLGANASASIGLVSTTTWLFWGVLSAAGTGFSVQVAHLIGSGDFEKARKVVRQAFASLLIFSTAIALSGVAISPFLPVWLGAEEIIHRDASRYFLIFASFLPALQISFLAGSMLRCAGNMKIPSMLNVMMCLIDVVLNFILIFPERDIALGPWHIHIWGAGMGVEGAALATVLAETIVAAIMLWYLWCRSPILGLWKRPGSFMPQASTLRKALKIGMPMGLEHIAICSAQIIITTIVAPLGVVAIAANAFAIIAESLCYMPGYGIGEAATTLAGQAYGAGRHKLVRRFGYITVGAAMAVMGLMGVALYLFAPQIISVMSPVEEIRILGAEILRIEAWAEPMFGAAIVSYGFFVGLGRTVLPSIMNLLSIWGVRLTLATLLAPAMGLKGVWLAMCIELCFRGLIFLALLAFGRWRKETLEIV